ncbi:MAG: hypothetical protein U1F58_08350 [Burkholderiales bacterium]
MSVKFLKIAVVYLMLGTLLGLYMGGTEKFTLAPVHAHLLLLGWASLALAGIIYHLHPAAAGTRLAHIHFWLHNIGLPVSMAALAMMLSGATAAGPVVGIGSTAIFVGLVLFAVNVLANVRAAS